MGVVDGADSPRGPAKHTAPLAVAVVVFVLGLLLLNFVEHTLTQERRASERALVAQTLSGVRDRLALEVQSSQGIANALVAIVAHEPRITQEEFATAGAHLLVGRPGVRSISLARDSVVSHMYPLPGNEKAVGLNLANHPAQGGVVRRSVEKGEAVLAGPVDLVQGGSAFILRTPVFLRDRDAGSADVYWGMVTVLLDTDHLIERVGLARNRLEHRHVRVSLWGHDANGKTGAPFYSTTSDLQAESVGIEMAVPGGSWFISGEPLTGWANSPRSAALFWTGGILLATFVALAAGLLVHSRKRLERELLAKSLAERELLEKALELERTLTEVKTLEGLVPICSHCKNVRDDEGMWNRLERYIEDHSDAMVSHGICPTCLETHYGEELSLNMRHDSVKESKS